MITVGARAAAAVAVMLAVAGCVPRTGLDAGGARPGAGTVALDPPAGTIRGADTGGTARGGAGDWAPGPGVRWQIQLAGPLVTTDATVYDLDPYTTAEETVTDLHRDGAMVMCHLDVGVADGTLPDAARLTGPVLAARAGATGRWLDIRRWDLIAPVLSDRIGLCRMKGFDAVDADHADGYAHPTGLPLTHAQQRAYDIRVARLAHAAGLAVGERTGPALAGALRPYLDFAVVAGCQAAGDCAAWFGYIDRGKAVFDVETTGNVAACGRARAYGFTAALQSPDLGTSVLPC